MNAETLQRATELSKMIQEGQNALYNINRYASEKIKNPEQAMIWVGIYGKPGWRTEMPEAFIADVWNVVTTTIETKIKELEKELGAL